MEFDKLSVSSCCGATSMIFIIKKPIDANIMHHLASSFKELPHFTKNGILYMENDESIITGTIGQNKITLKFKSKNIDSIIHSFELLLNSL